MTIPTPARLFAALFLAVSSFTPVSPLATTAQADDSLFSSVDIDSVFDSAASATADDDRSAVTRSEKVRSVDHLGRLLRIESFSPKKVDERTFEVTLEHDDWTFPTLVTLTGDRERIGLIIGLVRFEETSEMTTDYLVGLLGENQSVAPFQFAFNKDRSRSELTLIVENDNVDSGSLAKDLRRIARVAAGTADVWKRPTANKNTTDSNNTTADNKTTANKPAVNNPPTGTTLSPSQLVGQWASSQPTGEAFAFEFTSAGNFKLVHVKSGQTNLSSGTFGLRGNQLVLTTSGMTLTGTARLINATTFELVLNGNTLTFTKA